MELARPAGPRIHRQRGKLLGGLIRRLVVWAEHEFKLQKPLREGGTVRDAFALYERQRGRPHPDATPLVRSPDAVRYLFRWYREIERGRPSTFGLAPIGAGTILDWARLRRIDLEQWEIDALFALDAAYLGVMSGGDEEAIG